MKSDGCPVKSCGTTVEAAVRRLTGAERTVGAEPIGPDELGLNGT